MPNVIKMPTPVPRDSQELPSLPNYAGHFLCLNPEKVRTFQCGGFILGPRGEAFEKATEAVPTGV